MMGFHSDSLKLKGGTKLCQVGNSPVRTEVGLMDQWPEARTSGFSNAVNDEMSWAL